MVMHQDATNRVQSKQFVGDVSGLDLQFNLTLSIRTQKNLIYESFRVFECKLRQFQSCTMMMQMSGAITFDKCMHSSFQKRN